LSTSRAVINSWGAKDHARDRNAAVTAERSEDGKMEEKSKIKRGTCQMTSHLLMQLTP
jgi:hypothetical protein